jgi:hypothetical protein
MSNHNDDNHSNQLNPNNDSYYQSRGYDGREDYYDDTGDEDYCHPRPQADAPSGPSYLERRNLGLLADFRSNVASSMKASKAGEILCAGVGNMFTTISLTNASEDRTLRVKVSGCKIDSDVTDELRVRVKRWARTLSWMIEGCVDKTEIIFEE